MEEEDEEEGKLDSFLNWASRIGISDSPNTSNSQTCLGYSLKVSSFPDAGGRGLGAVRDLKKGELILIVPKSALITTQALSLNDHKLSVALCSYPFLSSTQRLIVCLLYEMGKGKSSCWFTYLFHLPRAYDVLATFCDFEKEAFQVDDAIWATEKAVAKAESEWKESKALLDELQLKPQLRTIRAWLWAFGTISSRTLHVPWDEAGCLCPVGDLFNYAAPGEELSSFSSIQNEEVIDGVDADQFDSNSQRLTDGGFEDDLDAYCFYARKNYRKGDQVLLSYGMYTNLELLEHYGFLLNENQNDKVFIPLEPDIYSSSSWPKDSLYIHPSGKPSFALLSALRLHATPQSQRKSVGHLLYSGSQVSIENETSIMKWISEKCMAILKNLPTSIEEDNLLLSAIDRIQNSSTELEVEEIQSIVGREALNFLEVDVHCSGGSLSKKSRSRIDRWRLAVEWRLMYKNSLLHSIRYCAETVRGNGRCIDYNVVIPGDAKISVKMEEREHSNRGENFKPRKVIEKGRTFVKAGRRLRIESPNTD
ncbi:protein SET DOMAIN GROUP 40 [Rutidosis leptorrhynchoides]|uniref:protein SET DOMAIN GROUP 40 n=1 Tax=Rutidosis leptorrhynchoides TaxID=125765 RepID=UPI003A9A488B